MTRGFSTPPTDTLRRALGAPGGRGGDLRPRHQGRGVAWGDQHRLAVAGVPVNLFAPRSCWLGILGLKKKPARGDSTYPQPRGNLCLFPPSDETDLLSKNLLSLSAFPPYIIPPQVSPPAPSPLQLAIITIIFSRIPISQANSPLPMLPCFLMRPLPEPGTCVCHIWEEGQNFAHIGFTFGF